MFSFKQFTVADSRSAMKVGTDGVLLGAWSPLPLSADSQNINIWDIGSGTGLIALMLAQRAPSARVTAVEIDSNASLDAADNIASSPWADRISLVTGDIFAIADSLPRPDMIVSNPPFFNEKILSPDRVRRTARTEGTLGVDSLMTLAAKMLPTGGTLSFIAPHKRLDDIEYHASLLRLTPLALVPVVSRQGNAPSRLLVHLVKGSAPSTVVRTPISIRDTDNHYTDRYRTLTDHFYLHLR